jgi:glyoxylase-like metal-dependent hydrolase (beta-lactamase superfamily II)
LRSPRRTHAPHSLSLLAAPAGGWLHARGVKPNTPPHSLPVPPSTLTTCTVTVVPILDNNYAYLLIDKATRNAAVVDPADPYAVLRAVAAANVTLTHILTTHHHHDHAGACALPGAAAARAGAHRRARARRERLRGTLTTCASRSRLRATPPCLRTLALLRQAAT